MLLWYATMSLAIEAGGVIAARLSRISLGGTDGAAESHLMVTEKISAAFEAAAILASGGNASHVVDNYRRHVAANASRLQR
jgi:aromatic ring-opening dioxygenase catalytic subunit (LigB family)